MTSRRAIAVLLLCLGCSKGQPAPVPPPPASPASPAAAEGPPPEVELKAVYEGFEGPPLPLAAKLCAALYDLPEARRAACCQGRPASGLGGECVRVVSAALRSGGVRLDEAGVERCRAAQARAHEGCSWVGQWHPPLPAECDGLFEGSRKDGELCRSSLECAGGSHCLGGGPMDAGRCGPPRGAGDACLTAVDPLASYARQNPEARHRECQGFCGHRKCQPIAAPGSACSIAPECPPGQHCDGKTCVAPAFASRGQRCVGGACAPGLRCLGGSCAEAKPEGAACKEDVECRGGCLPATHRCGMRCELP